MTCTREIIKNANLNTEEYNRLTAILQESTRAANDYHEQLKQHVIQCEESQRMMFDEFIDTFNYNLETGENYDKALYAIVNFANHAGIALQHVDFNDFKSTMISVEIFELK
jgi:putative hemolysin